MGGETEATYVLLVPFNESEKVVVSCLYAALATPMAVVFLFERGSNITASRAAATMSNPAGDGFDRFVEGGMLMAIMGGGKLTRRGEESVAWVG